MTTRPQTSRCGRRVRRRGGAVLEAAMVLPILLMLGFGTVEFGHFFYLKHTLLGAAREGARAAVPAGADAAAVRTAVASVMAASGFDASRYTVTTSPANPAAAAEGTPVTVTVQCNWSDVGLRPIGLISANKAVTAVAVMRRE